MRFFSGKAKLALASGLLLVCAIGLARASSAYTETRSFRDALDGRSMEEAMSGPVDRDTSSYGERTASGGATGASAGGRMMLSIPANGNLMSGSMDQQQQQEEQLQQQQQKGEQETATEPEMEQQQKMLEPMQAALMEMGARQQQQQKQRMLMMMMMKNARQQQQQQEEESSTETSAPTKSSGGPAEQGFGDEAPAKQPADTKGANQGPAGEQQKYDEQMGQKQEQQVPAAKGAAQASDEQLAAKQRAMAAMLMTMSKAMGYQTSGAQGASGYSSGSASKSGASLMMMKKMMMMNAAEAAAKQPALMMMMSPAPAAPQMKAYSRSPMSAAISTGGSSYGANQNYGRSMRRASQRKSAASRKMSPAMVNTLLNKMMAAGKPAPAKPDAMAMLMKSAAGAELLGNMMAGGSPTAARDQYKRMMMAALMKQARYSARQEPARTGRQQQQQQPAKGSAMSTSGARGNYAGMSPVALMMNMMSAQKQMEQQQEMGAPSYASDRTSGVATAASRQRASSKTAYEQRQMEPASSGNAQTGFGEDSTTTTATPATKSGRAGAMQMQMQMPVSVSSMQPSKLAMMMSNGAAARGAAKYAQMSRPMSTAMSKQYNNRPAAYMSQATEMPQREEMQEEQMSSTTPEAPTTTTTTSSGNSGAKGAAEQVDEDEEAPATTAAPMPRPASSNGMRPLMMMSYRPAGAQVKGLGQQEQSAQQDSQEPQQDSQMNAQDAQDQMDNQQKQEDSVKGAMQQQQVDGSDEGGAAPRGMAEPFAFDYKVEDEQGNEQYRKEESDKNGAVRGSYGYMDTNGLYRHVEYVADENGFRANVKSNEPGLSSEPLKLSSAAAANSQQQQQAAALGGGTMAARPTGAASSGGVAAAAGSQPTQQQQQSMSQLMLDAAQQLMAAKEEANQQQQQQQQQQQSELSADESLAGRRRA